MIPKEFLCRSGTDVYVPAAGRNVNTGNVHLPGPGNRGRKYQKPDESGFVHTSLDGHEGRWETP